MPNLNLNITNYFSLLYLCQIIYFMQNDSQEIDLKCGEDCVILTTKKSTIYELDIFFPYIISQQSISVTFNTVSKVSALYLEILL